ncbi:MAG: hypothetical protein Q9160_003349 [Pyrenula sp. 1 TL-2023]
MEVKPLELKINGSSTIIRRAERAVVSINIFYSSDQHESAAGEVIKTVNALQEKFKVHCPRTTEGVATDDAAITHWAMNSLSTSSRARYDRDNKPLPREYSCKTQFIVKFRDFSVLGAILTELSTTPNVEISNISWRVSDATKSSLGTQSRKEAVEDAVLKARDFASVLTDKPPRAILMEERSSSSATSSHMRYRRTQADTANSSGENNGLSFEPEDISLTTNVHVKFEVNY